MKLSKCFGTLALGVAFVGVPAVPVLAEDVQYKTITRDDMPREARHEADAQTKGGSDVQYQRRSEGGKTFYSIHWTKDGKRWEARLDDQGKVVDGPQEARDQARAGREGSREGREAREAREKRDAAGGDDVGVKYHGISARDVNKEVPEAVRRTMDKHTAGASDLFYQSQLRDGKKFYSVHYNKDGKRMFVRVAESGELALGPAESRSQKEYKPGADKIVSSAPVKREAITVEQLPAAVRKTVETSTGGGTDHSFVKQSRGDEVLYVVEFNRNGQRTSAIIDGEGRIVEGESFAAAAPTPATPAPTPPPATPDPRVTKAETDAQLAAAKEASTAPYRLLGSADDLPAEVRKSIEKDLAGASDPLFERYIQDGKTAYSIHYTTLEGRRMFTAVDETGKVLIQPRKSNWQEGGKGVRFTVIGADQLPAQVRTAVEEQGGTAHMFLQRKDADGKETFLVQFNDPKGERMEVQVSPDGKVIGKARKAHEQPFTILDRKS